jgi:hypothetical protein
VSSCGSFFYEGNYLLTPHRKLALILRYLFPLLKISDALLSNASRAYSSMDYTHYKTRQRGYTVGRWK